LQTQGNDDTGKRVALISGASSGIGAAFARALAARGYALVLVARRRDRLEELAGALRRNGGTSVEVLVADLAHDEDLEAVARKVASETQLELLVNNAGFGALGDYHEADLTRQMEMHRVHVLATVRLTHAALRGLVARGRGGVINVSSVAAFARMPGHTSYNATKAWMNAFTECLHLELKRAGSPVRIQALCPGYTYTEFHDALGMDRGKVMPLRGFWMTAEFVVAESLKAFDRGAWLVVPGWRYRLLVGFLKHAPRFLLYTVQMKIARLRISSSEKTR
jgi:short-subunit dehydrogenase